MQKNLLFFYLCISFSWGNVSVILSNTIQDAIYVKGTHKKLFQPIIVRNESLVLPKFEENEANFAFVREDKLREYQQRKEKRPYHIIGKLKQKSILYFLTKSEDTVTVESLKYRRLSIGILGDETNVYLKEILQEHKLSYQINTHSLDFFHSLSALKNNQIGAIFMFERESFKKTFRQYIKPYPSGFFKVLSKNKALHCVNGVCSASYYLIAADSVGRAVMHNIAVLIESRVEKKEKLSIKLGNYFIDTKVHSFSVPMQKKVVTKDKKESPKFFRTPWMDVAILEAIKGKGSAENVFPMLDLSYKYIRFSKGEKGIVTAPNDSKEGAWCAAYICWTLNKSGFKVHNKWRMASQSFRYFKKTLYRKIDTPIFGAITLYTSMTNPSHGHVGYLFGRTKRGKNILLGGNQNNRLKFSEYAIKGFGSYRFNGFYIPILYQIKAKDRLTNKDVYSSASILNKRYGIEKSRQTGKVR